MARDKRSEDVWGIVWLVGIALVIIGVSITIYSAYSLLTIRQSFVNQSAGGVSNGSPIIISSSGGTLPTNGQARFGFSPFDSPDMVLIGVLLALLGFTTFKYADLVRRIP